MGTGTTFFGVIFTIGSFVFLRFVVLSTGLVTGFAVRVFELLYKAGVFCNTLRVKVVMPYPQSPSWLGAGTQVPSSVCSSFCLK